MCLYWDFVYVLDHKEIKDLKAFMQIVIIIIIFFIIYLFFSQNSNTPLKYQ